MTDRTTFRLSFAREHIERLTAAERDTEQLTLAALLESQARLLREHTTHHISFGPNSIPTPPGWKRSPDIAYRCLICGYLLRSMTTDYETCFCGEMSVDIAAGRFGSGLGDQSIEVVRLLPRGN
ncbi:MAG: hypothetical protein ACREJO_13675 [Phycisphaerales bacterium]